MRKMIDRRDKFKKRLLEIVSDNRSLLLSDGR